MICLLLLRELSLLPLTIRKSCANLAATAVKINTKAVQCAQLAKRFVMLAEKEVTIRGYVGQARRQDLVAGGPKTRRRRKKTEGGSHF